MKNRVVLLLNTLLVFSLLVISACGGGGGGTNPPPPPANAAPTANAGADQTVASNSGTVTLTGSGADSDGTVASYSWSSSNSISIIDAGLASATFTAPTLNVGDADLVLTFILTVTDNDAATDTDDVVITVTAPLEPVAESDTSWDIMNSAPVVNKVAFNGTKYIAVGVGGYVAESTNGQDWSIFDNGSTINFDELAVNGNGVVAIESAGRFSSMAVTTDGTNWQLVSTADNADCTLINSVTHDGTQFVGIFDYVNICTSSDGLAWQLQSTQQISMLRIVFGSNKYAILISDGLVTIDSLTSTSINAPALPLSSSGRLRDLIYGGSTFVGLRQGEIIYSANADDWSVVTSAVVPANVISISHSDSKGFVAMTNDNDPLLYSSSNAVDWTLIVNDLPLLSGWFGRIVNGANETLLFNNDSVRSSADQMAWSLASLENQPTGNVTSYFKHNNTHFVVTNFSSEFHISSDNGVSWGVSSNALVGGIYSIVHDGSRFVAAGTDGVSTSDDGISWTSAIGYQMNRPLIASATLGTTTYNFSYTGNFDTKKSVLSSDDGVNFQVDNGLYGVITSNFLGGVKQVASNSSILVGITDNTIINYDGSVWAAPEQAISSNLTDVIWSGSHFVIVGDGGLVMTSTDGNTWTAQTWFNFNATITDVLAVGTDLYATDSDGIIASSSDGGVTWIERKDFSTSGNIIGQLSHDGTSFYGFGRNAGLGSRTLATSTDGVIWSASSAVFDNVIPDHHVNYESSNSRFISTYYASDTDQIYASANAASWALTSEIPTNASYAYIQTQKDLAALRYGPLNVVGGSSYTSGSAAYSANGLNWTITTNQMYYPGYTPQSGIYASGSGNGNDVGTKNGSVGTILVSSDGINYADATLNGLTSSNPRFEFIKYVNNQYIGVQLNTDTETENPGVYTSSDGSNWTLRKEADFNPLWAGQVSDIEYDGTQYLFLFRSDKGSMILKTADLENFTFVETMVRVYMTDLIVEADGYRLTGSSGTIATHGLY